MPTDTAKATFDTAIGRAEYLLRLAHGLTNHRQRGIRSDWAQKFKAFMHWPQSHNISRVDSEDALIVLRKGATVEGKDFSSESTADILRGSLVMAVSAMDAYFHAKVVQHVVKHSRKKNPSNRLLKEKICVQDFIEGRKKKRTNVALRAAIERNLSYQSLQQPDRIADALGLIGVSDFWKGVAKRLSKQEKAVRKELGEIVKRRNQIAHEGDLSQSKKTRNKTRAIAHAYVEKGVALINAIVEAAEKEISSQL